MAKVPVIAVHSAALEHEFIRYHRFITTDTVHLPQNAFKRAELSCSEDEEVPLLS